MEKAARLTLGQPKLYLRHFIPRLQFELVFARCGMVCTQVVKDDFNDIGNRFGLEGAAVAGVF